MASLNKDALEEFIERHTPKSKFELWISRIIYERGVEFFDKILLAISLLAALSLVPAMIIRPEMTPHYVAYALLMFLGPYGFYRAYIDKVTDDIERIFPDFLRDLAENRRSGMSLVESMKIQARGNYGRLTAFIQQMAASMAWGITIFEALDKLASKIRSNLIKRALTIIKEGADSGGEFSDVLHTAARDLREILELDAQRRSQTIGYLMTMYISYAVFIFVILIVLVFFLPRLGQSATIEGSVGGITILPIDVRELSLVLYYGSIIQSLGVGLVGGLVYEGKISGSLKHMFILVTMTYVIFRFVGII